MQYRVKLNANPAGSDSDRFHGGETRPGSGQVQAWGITALMSDIDDYQRRIAAALDRIGRGLESMPSVPSATARPPVGRAEPAGVSASAAATENAKLRSALEEEKTANAQLTERLKALKDRDGSTAHALSAKVDAMTRQLDVQGLEMQRLRKTTVSLREQLRVMTEAATRPGGADAGVINKAMQAELEALRAARASETAELDEILSELTPLIREAAADA